MFTSRTTSCLPGGRCWAWFSSGGMELPAGVPNGFEIRYPAQYCVRDEHGVPRWNLQFAWQIDVAPDVPAGTYRVGPVEVRVTALHHRRPFKTVSTETSAKKMNELLATHDLQFAPGDHTIERPLIVPDGGKLWARFPGTSRLVRMPDSEPFHRMFIPSGAMTLRGLELTHHEDIDSAKIVYLHTHPMPKGHVTLENFRVAGGRLQMGMAPGLWLRNGVFDRASTGPLWTAAVVERCKFCGHCPPGIHSWLADGAQGVLTYDCTWDGTTRGQVLQTGPCRGSMNLNLHFNGIRGGENNANEVILLEGGNDGKTSLVDGMQDNTWVDVWQDGCGGPALMLHGSGITATRAWNFRTSTEHTSLQIAAENGGQISNTLCENWQAAGAIDLRGDCGNLTLNNYQLFDGVRFAPNGEAPSAVWEVQRMWPVRNHGAVVNPTIASSGSWRRGDYQPLVSL